MDGDGIEHILVRFPQHDRGFLIPILQEVQEHYGFLDPERVDEVAAFTGASASEVFGVASFYAQFRFTRPGRHQVKVCLGTACHVRGGTRILELLQRQLKIKDGETTPGGAFSLERVACFGCCALAPVVVVDKDVHGRITSTKARNLLRRYGGS